MEAVTVDMADYNEICNIIGLTKYGVNSPNIEAFHNGT